MVTTQGSDKNSFLGNDTGLSVTAAATISNLTGTFTYYNEPDACGGTTAYVRYFFTTSKSGGFNETQYWWSNPTSAALTANGSVTLRTLSFAGSNWSDFYGHFGNDPLYSAGFNAAVSDVTTIGLSFGGGCFFENGVGTTDGSGTFTLNTFTVG